MIKVDSAAPDVGLLVLWLRVGGRHALLVRLLGHSSGDLDGHFLDPCQVGIHPTHFEVLLKYQLAVDARVATVDH